jgi:hypothetical protein
VEHEGEAENRNYDRPKEARQKEVAERGQILEALNQGSRLWALGGHSYLVAGTRVKILGG